MFYAHFVLAKKGPLAKIWLAAHWDKKLTKAHVFETNIEKPGMVDLPEEHREAAMNAITLPEVFHDFDTAMPELNEVDIEAQFSLNQSRAEEITMREDYGSLNLVTHDDGFGDMGFDTDNPDIMREAIGNEGALEQSNLLFADGSSLELTGKEAGPSAPRDAPRLEPAPAHLDDGFGANIADVPDFGHAGGLFEGDLFGDVTAGSSGAGTSAGLPGTSTQPQSLQAEIEAAGERAAETDAAAGDAHDSDDDMPDHYDAGNSPQHSWGGSPPHEPDTPRPMDTDGADLMPPPAVPRPPSVRPMEVDNPEIATAEAARAETPAPALDTTTLLNNDEESFALAPVDATVLKGITKTKRKRKLIVDEVKNISGEEMKNQLSNTSDIVTTLDLAPPTKRLMHWKETGGVEKLFSLPARPIPSRVLFKKYQRNMTLRGETEEADAAAARSPDPEPVRRAGRKRRHEESLQPPETPAPSTVDMEPPTPVPQEYEPSIGGMLSSLGPPMTPGVLGSLTPGTLLQGGLTPGSLQHGSMTPGGLGHGGMTPGGLQHGDSQPVDLGLGSSGMTPAGLHHGGMTPGGMTPGGMTPGGMTPGLGLDSGMTPGGLVHGGLTPAGLHHGGMTPGGLDHGGMTPGGLQHGGLTPGGLQHGGMTPGGLQHGGLTPGGLQHGGLTPGGLQHGGITPAGLQHGGMTPSGLQHGALLQHSMEQLPMMPQIGGEQVSSLLSRSVASSQPPHHDLPHTMPMDPLPLHGLDEHSDYQAGMQMTNLGYDDQHGHHSPPHDYDLPLSVENGEEGSREAGETEEQFSERVLNRRAAQLFAVMRPKLASEQRLSFAELAPPHNNRKQVAQKFYSLLVLKKHQVLKLEQNDTYGPITIYKGDEFETETI
ncbi:unnamed protein product, partial [Iphiclides podalirius]